MHEHMFTDIHIEMPDDLCLVAPDDAESDPGSGTFTLLLGQKVHRFETPAFHVPGTDLRLKLRILRRTNTTCGEMGIQFLLMDSDVIEIRINGQKAILTSGPGSFVYYVLSNQNIYPGQKILPSTTFFFELTHALTFKPSDQMLARERDVKLVVGGKKIPVSKELLISKSEVFRAMFEYDTKERQTGVVEITDFSFQVVKLMRDFVMFDYCTHWDTKYEELVAIADKYDIIGLMQLAEKKKQLLDQLL